MKRIAIPLLLSSTLWLNACGDSTLERVGSGAVIGGAGGFAAGGICCHDPANDAAGFFIGAAVGAIIGLVLDHPLFFNTHPDS
jgi:hypothetical protein